jgi:hypothetical protein
MHEAAFVKERVFGEDTISSRPAQGLPHLLGCNSAFQPFRIENGSDAIPNSYSRDAVSRGSDSTYPVGQRNPGKRWLPSAHAVDNEMIPIVDRKCLHLDYNLPSPWHRVGTLYEL